MLQLMLLMLLTTYACFYLLNDAQQLQRNLEFGAKIQLLKACLA
jgi:hypothetical protein